MVKKSIGWIAVHRRNPDYYGGFGARCKVYDSYRRALGNQRKRVRVDPGKNWPQRSETDEEVLAKWDILEAFVEVEDEN